MSDTAPTPPPGFTLDSDQSAAPTPPPGFTLDGDKNAAPTPPAGFTIDATPEKVDPDKWLNDQLSKGIAGNQLADVMGRYQAMGGRTDRDDGLPTDADTRAKLQEINKDYYTQRRKDFDAAVQQQVDANKTDLFAQQNAPEFSPTLVQNMTKSAQAKAAAEGGAHAGAMSAGNAFSSFTESLLPGGSIFGSQEALQRQIDQQARNEASPNAAAAGSTLGGLASPENVGAMMAGGELLKAISPVAEGLGGAKFLAGGAPALSTEAAGQVAGRQLVEQMVGWGAGSVAQKAAQRAAAGQAYPIQEQLQDALEGGLTAGIMHMAPGVMGAAGRAARGAKESFGQFLDRFPEIVDPDLSKETAISKPADQPAPLDEAAWRSRQPDAAPDVDGAAKSVFKDYQTWAETASPEDLKQTAAWLEKGPTSLQQKVARRVVGEEISRRESTAARGETPTVTEAPAAANAGEPESAPPAPSTETPPSAPTMESVAGELDDMQARADKLLQQKGAVRGALESPDGRLPNNAYDEVKSAVPEPGPGSEVSRAAPPGEDRPADGGGIRQGEQGKEAAGASVTQAQKGSVSPVEVKKELASRIPAGSVIHATNIAALPKIDADQSLQPGKTYGQGGSSDTTDVYGSKVAAGGDLGVAGSKAVLPDSAVLVLKPHTAGDVTSAGAITLHSKSSMGGRASYVRTADIEKVVIPGQPDMTWKEAVQFAKGHKPAAAAQPARVDLTPTSTEPPAFNDDEVTKSYGRDLAAKLGIDFKGVQDNEGLAPNTLTFQAGRGMFSLAHGQDPAEALAAFEKRFAGKSDTVPTEGKSNGQSVDRVEASTGGPGGQPPAAKASPQPSTTERLEQSRRARSVEGIKIALRKFRRVSLSDDGRNLHVIMPDGSRVPWHLVDSIEPKDSEIGDYLTSARAANDGKLWFEYDDGRGNPEDVKLPVDKAGWDLLSDQHRAMIKDTFRSHGNYDPVADAITTSHRVAHDSSIGAEEIFHALANRLRKADRDTYNKMLNKYDSEDDAFRAFALGKSRSQYFDRIKRGTAHLTSSAQDKKLTPRQKAEGLLVAAAQRDGVLMSDDEFESFVDDAGGLHPDVLVDYRVRDKNGDLVMEDGQPKLTKDGKILAAFVNEGAQSNVVEELGSARAEKMQQRIIDEVLMKKADKIQLAAEHYAAQPFGDPELRDAAHLVLGTPAGMVEGEEQEPPADPAEQEEVPFAVRREGEGEKKVLGQKHLLGEEHDESDIGSKTGDLFGNIKVDKPAATKPEPVDPDQLKLFAIRRRAWDEETTLPAPAPEAPEPPGTKPKETLFGMPERGPTGLKKSQVDEERARRGLAPLAGKVRGWGEDAAAVMDAIERDPRAQDRLLDELTDKPRALTSYDVAMLTHFKIELHNERAAVAKGIIDAAGRGDEGRAVVQSLQVRESQISDRLLQIERAGVSEKGSSSETGRGLAALRQLRNEDFSLASMETQERAARGGRQLTPKESEEIKHLQKKITEANERFDEFVKRSQAQRQRKRATAAVNQMAAAVPASRPSRADLQARREGLIAGIRQMVASHRGTLGGQFAVRAEGEEGPDQQATAKTDWSQIPGLGKAVKDFARTYIEDGMRGLDPVVDAVHKALGISGFTKSDVMDALSGYGKFKELSKDEIDKLMRDLQAQALNVRKLEDLTSGKPPLKTGAEREPMSDDVRRLVQKVNEAKRRMGVATTDPATQLRSALESVKTRLRNQISDLEYQIARREKIVPKKASAPSDAETEKLSKDRDTLRLQYDKIFGDSQLSDADRMKLALASVQRSIEELDSKIANRDLFPRKGFKSSSPALEAAKATRESRQADLEALRAADVGYQNMLAEKEHAAKVAALQAKIDAVGKKIAAGKTPAAPGAEEAETSPEIQAMEKQLKTLQGTLKGINAPAPADPAVAALAQLKARLRNRMAELATKMATNDYAPKPPAAAVAPDAEAISLLADKTRWEESFRDRLANIRRADRPMVDKLLDAMSSWTRMGVISSVDTLEKLAMAGVWRYLTTPIDSAIGRGISHALPGLARRAPRHGFPSIEAEAAALTRNHLATLKAMKDRLRTGKSDLDLLHDKGVKFPPTWMDWVAHTHMAINTPAEMNEYSRSYQQRTAWGIRNGLDVTTPAAQLRISAEAYQDAQRIVFRGDNRLHDSVVAAIQAMERKDKTTGRIPLHGKLGATALRVAIPVSKVPSNVLAETMNRLFGAEIGAVRAAAAYARGVRELPEAQADSIMRQLTQGSPSAALMLLGFLTASYFGGFWTGDKRQPGAPKPMGMKIGGYQVPPKLLHSPWFAALHFGATIRRVADATVRGNKKGITDGILAAALGLLDQVPYVADQAEISRLYEPNTRDQAAADLVLNRAVPGAVRWGAQAMDTDAQGKPVQRKPGTFKQALEADLPGLRSQVPKQQGSGLFGRKR